MFAAVPIMEILSCYWMGLDASRKIYQKLMPLSVCSPNMTCCLGECTACQYLAQLEEELFSNSEYFDLSTPWPYLQWVDYKKVEINATLSAAKHEVIHNYML